MSDDLLHTAFHCRALVCKGLHYITCIRRQQAASGSIRSKKRRNWDNVDGAILCAECLDCNQGKNIIKKLGITKPVRQRVSRFQRAMKGQDTVRETKSRKRRCRNGLSPYSPHYTGASA